MIINTYTCVDCGAEFDTPLWISDTVTYATPAPAVLVCPRCHGVFVETHVCDICLRQITGDYIRTSNGDEICPDCYTEQTI